MDLRPFLKTNPQIEFLRYQWLDVGNILRLIVVTKEYALKMSLNNSPLKVSCLAFGVLPDDSFNTTRFAPAGYDELHPDWQTLRVCTYLENKKSSASVMCFVKEQSRNFPAWERDPRTVLQRALKHAEETFGGSFLVGFELEFFLADATNRGATRPTDSLSISQFYGAVTLRDPRVLIS